MKSKIKFIIVLFILVLVGVAIAIPKTTYQKWFGSTMQTNNEEPNENQILRQVYVLDEKGYLVGIDLMVNSEEDEIVQKWNLLTKDSHQIPSGFTSVVNKKATLIDYEVKDAVLELNVTDEIQESNGRKTLEALAWTFINDEITEVKLLVNDQVLSQVNDYHISRITKKMGINLEYETAYLLESNATTVVFYEENMVKPVTFFHLEDDICSYIVNKTATLRESEQVWNYQYELNEDRLVINFQDGLVLDELLLQTLASSLDYNFELTKLTINNVEKNLYEAVFGEIVEE